MRVRITEDNSGRNNGSSITQCLKTLAELSLYILPMNGFIDVRIGLLNKGHGLVAQAG